MEKRAQTYADIQLDLLNRCLPGGVIGGLFEEGLPLFFVNNKMLEYLQYQSIAELEQAVKGHVQNCIHPEDRERVINEVREQYKDGFSEYSSTYRLLKKDGTSLWVIGKGRLFTAENGQKILWTVCIDSTEQKELEQQLELYRHASRGGAFVVELREGFPLLYGNDIFHSILGYSPEEMLDKHQNNCLNIVHPDDRQRIRHILLEAVEGTDSSIEWEMRISKADGSICWILVRGNIKHDNKGLLLLDGFIVDTTDKYLLMEEIKRSEERYRIALDKANITVWEYDISSRNLLQAPGAAKVSGMPELIKNVPDCLDGCQMIHPDSLADIKQLYNKLAAGDPKAEADIQICWPPGKVWWEHITYTTVFDSDGKPVRAVGVGEDITLQKEAELNYQRELQVRDTMSVGFIAGSRADITNNVVEFLQQTNSSSNELYEGMPYDDMMLLGAKAIVNQDDKERYLAIFSRKNLLEAYSQDKTTLSIDYRRLSSDGRINWVNATIRLIKDTISGNIYSYSSIRDITTQKTIELALRQRAERDVLTGAYNKETTMEMIRDASAQSVTNNQSYALLVFNVDNFTGVVKKIGYRTADKIIQELYSLLQMEFHDPKIIGRTFGDELAVWVGNNSEKSSVRKSAEKIIRTEYINNLAHGVGSGISVSAGIVFSDDDDFSYSPDVFGMERSGIFDMAWTALSRAQETGGNQCVVYDKRWRDDPNEHVSNTHVHVSLDVSDILLHVSTAFNTAQSLSKALNSTVLKELGHFYGCDYCYVLEVEGSENHISRCYSWLLEDGAELTPKGTWLDFLNESHVVMDTDTSFKFELGLGAVYSTVLKCDGKVLGYLVLGGPRKNLDDTILFSVLRSMIPCELHRQRLCEDRERLNKYDSLTNALNRLSYLSYMEHIMPDALISFGVVSVDINGLKIINTRYGDNYGDKMIQLLVKIMQNELSGAMVFRIAGDEFVALCENLSYNTFQNSSARIRMRFEDSYPGILSLGYAWGDTDINPDNLIAQAEERMLISKQSYYKEYGVLARYHDPKGELKLLDDIASGCYRVFLQPKASVSTGVICGAEALVRYVDLSGNFVQPDRFIPQLEQDGNISYIDLFVFEEVCKVLKRWIEKGLKVIPISLNFSRSTLLAENLVIQMNSIYSKYMVPKELIEIEITESMGSVERETIINIGTEIASHHYRLALDDFGAKYSNLSILSAMQLDVLKLDKSLVNDLFSNPNTRIVVRNFLVACQELHIESVAEGVETKEQLDALSLLGCDYAQGYYFNKPIPWQDFENIYLLDC